MPERRRVEPVGLDLAVADHPHRRRRGGGQLVEAVVPPEDQRPAAAARPAPRPCTGAIRAVGAADRRGHRPGRVGQRAEEVEDGARCPSRAAGRRRAACRGGRPARRRSRCRPPATQRATAGGRQVDGDAERLEHVGGARRTTTRPGRRAWRPGTPAAAVTTAAIVEMFTVCAPSPPVPTMSTQSSGSCTGVAWASISAARPATSSADSPLARSATAKAATCTGRRLAGHHLAHRPRGVGGGEVLPGQQPVEQPRPGRAGRPRRASSPTDDGAPRVRRAAGPRPRRARSAGRPAAAACPRPATSAPASGRPAGR